MATKKRHHKALTKKEAHTLVRLARKASTASAHHTARDASGDRRKKRRSRDAYDKRRRHARRRR